MISFRTALALLFAFALAATLRAQEATLGLSSPTTSPGQQVEIVLTVRDARSADVPETLNVPGLQIQLFGRSTRFEMNNFQITSSLTFTYTVISERTGEFDIPPVTVQVGGKTIQTNPLRLNVVDSALGMPSAQPMLPPATDPGCSIWAGILRQQRWPTSYSAAIAYACAAASGPINAPG